MTEDNTELATWDSEGNRIKGSDGEWYDVPEPVLERFMLTAGLSTQRGRPPLLIRDQDERVPVTRASPNAMSLLLTDGLLSQVTAYMETGELEALTDLVELAHSLAIWRGVTHDQFAEMVKARENYLGGFTGRLLMPEDAT